ncbi:hypothetical protein PIB30_091415 [Stylosanthes scabra]|uniref:Uncharacterized protein n=1 Tax=Stylosanthes scabra TaxID=79078 RepID=A0ABU6SWY0_9FABA|nr:hypothetical protein [Stylosanthes scabra]
MRPPPQGAESLGSRTEGNKIPSLMNGSIISCIWTDGRVWRTEGLFMSVLSVLTEKKGQSSVTAYKGSDRDSSTQNYVFLRGKKIPFTEAHIHGYLGIPGDAPDADIDNAFIALTKAYGRGEDVIKNTDDTAETIR